MKQWLPLVVSEEEVVVEWIGHEVPQFPLVSGVREVTLRGEAAWDRSNRHDVICVVGMQKMG
jgi:hypothetical protein